MRSSTACSDRRSRLTPLGLSDSSVCRGMMRQLSALFDRPAMTWWDVVDILIVSLLIYEALKLIRGTRAMQMAIGSVVVILLLLRLAGVSAADRRLADSQRARVRRRCGHRAVSVRHPSRAVAPGPRAVLPVPRPVASARPRRSRKSSRRPRCWPRRKVGAIIVFEREIGLRNYVESGIPIDAAVSYDLLTTIFQPGTPLHDGAVIISEDRIAAAACFLPLTVSPKLDRDLGTRHRAAIGLTEETRCDRRRRLRGARRDLARAARPDRAPAVDRRASRPVAGR